MFQSLIGVFSQSVTFQVISRGAVEWSVQGFTQGLEEVGDKLQTSIRGDMGQNSMLGEYMEDKEMGELSGGDSIMSWNEDRLFGKLINDDQDCCVTGGDWELLDEVLNLYAIYARNGTINILLPFTDLLRNTRPYVTRPTSFSSHLQLQS